MFWQELFIWNVRSSLSPFVAYIQTLYMLRVLSMEKHASSLIMTSGKNLSFWHKQITQLEKFNILWKSFSVNCCLMRIWYECYLISFWIIWLNNNADKPSPFHYYIFLWYIFVLQSLIEEFSLLLISFKNSENFEFWHLVVNWSFNNSIRASANDF